jgi:hypothetical protein
MDSTLLTTFRDDAWFGQIAPERQAKLLAAGRVRLLRNRQRVYRLGDPPNGLYGVISGEIRLIGYPVAGASCCCVVSSRVAGLANFRRLTAAHDRRMP